LTDNEPAFQICEVQKNCFERLVFSIQTLGFAPAPRFFNSRRVHGVIVHMKSGIVQS